MSKLDQIKAIKSAIDLAEFLAPYTHLRQSGKQFLGLCPLHDDSTPSFSVNAALGVWHCHGCQKGGNVFSFLKYKEGWSTDEAAAYLAERYNLPWQTTKPPVGGDLRTIHEIATRFFQQQLTQASGSGARAYIETRGLNADSVTRFKLGVTPEGGSGLTYYLTKQGFSRELLLESGLSIKSERNEGQIYDRFRERLIIPIDDPLGRTIAFAGRRLGEKGPKYLNSPVTPLFTKGDHLFGLSQASSAIRQRGTALLVEGHLDVIQCHQAGFRHTVAVMGTALGIAQIHKLHSAGRVIVIPDSDSAGVRAAYKHTLALLQQDIPARVALLRRPGEADMPKDADEFLAKLGPEAFALRVEQAIPGVVFLARVHLATLSRDPLERLQGLKGLGPLLLLLPSRPERMEVIRSIQERAGLDPVSVAEVLAPWCNQGVAGASLPRPQQHNEHSPGQREIMRLITQSPECRALAADYLDVDALHDPMHRLLAALLMEEDCPEDPAELPEWGPVAAGTPTHSLLLSLLTSGGEPLDVSRLKQLLIPYRMTRIRKRQVALRGEIADAETNGDEAEVCALLDESGRLGQVASQLESRRWPEDYPNNPI